MKNYIFFQTQNTVGVVPADKWNESMYYNETKPIRIALLEMTTQCANMLVDIFEVDKEAFIDIIKEELDNSPATLYSN